MRTVPVGWATDGSLREEWGVMHLFAAVGATNLAQAPRRELEASGPSSTCGSKSNWGYAGFGPCFHLPGFHLDTVFLSHSHMEPKEFTRRFPPTVGFSGSVLLWESNLQLCFAEIQLVGHSLVRADLTRTFLGFQDLEDYCGLNMIRNQNIVILDSRCGPSLVGMLDHCEGS